MKKLFIFLSVVAPCLFLFSFSTNRGGDIFRVFLNGRQVHQQFIDPDKTVKALHLTHLAENDKVEVFYSHCGHPGKGRVLLFKNEKEEVVREIKFPDEAGSPNLMGFRRKEVLSQSSGTLFLYYASKEMLQPRRIATISWTEAKPVAKKALL